jgi:hypothetical protein
MTESEFVSVQKMHSISGVDLNSLQIITTRLLKGIEKGEFVMSYNCLRDCDDW